MKYIKFLAVIAVLFITYFLINDSDLSLDDVKTIKVKSTKVETNKDMAKKNRKSTTVKKSVRSFSDSELFTKLQPPSNGELEEVWLDEYGCYNKGECKYYYLNARSYQEARWMKENGYPTQSMMALVNNPTYKGLLDEMARKKYPAALAIASISAMERGEFVEASNLALSNVAYSNKSETYPQLLYGEALLANNMKPLAVSRFYIAGLLGDSLSQGRATALSPDVYFSTSALNSAHLYLGRIFGGQIPNNPRPKYTDE